MQMWQEKCFPSFFTFAISLSEIFILLNLAKFMSDTKHLLSIGSFNNSKVCYYQAARQ